MSPEQARGEEVDARTDVWAFGCVLFEMLAGRRAFAADTASDSLGKILEQEPNWSALPTSTPAKLQHLLRQCLQKDRRRRLPSLAEARVVIDQLLAPRGLSRRAWMAIGAAAVLALAVGAYLWSRLDRRPLASRAEWVQLTNLDSVTQPALSPDGRMLAFIRGPSTFVSPGQLYVKLLPDGEPVALTNDTLPKMSPVFSPDGSRIAYTVNDGNSWDTWEVPTVRGAGSSLAAQRLGPDLVWRGRSPVLGDQDRAAHDDRQVAREPSGISRPLSSSAPRRAWLTAHYVSPDGTRALVVEMDEKGAWLPCRSLPIDGGASKVVGPSKARCTDAAWSPDGRWMYFSADAGDGFHIWRQRSPDGSPEQVTSGPTGEQGLAIAPDGKSLITAVGLVQRSVWFHDASGERRISLEGYAYFPLLSADGRKVCFRVTRGAGSGTSPSELWMVELGSGQKHRLFPGQLVTGYDVSRDDRVVAAVLEREGHTGVWVAWLDGREPPRRIPHADGDSPKFGRDGEILFRVAEKDTGVVYRSWRMASVARGLRGSTEWCSVRYRRTVSG